MDMQDRSKIIFESVENRGLFQGFLEYSDLICKAPTRFVSSNHYNNYTPKGHGLAKNPSFHAELTKWKREKLFPFFIEAGYDKKDLAEAWKKWVKLFKK